MMPNDPNGATAEGMPPSKNAGERDQSFSIPPAIMNLDLAPLRRMNAKDLRDLQSTLNTLLDVAHALSSLPNIEGKDGKRTVALFMNDLCELLGGAHDAVFEATKALDVATAEDIEHRAWCILRVRSDWADELMDVSADAAEFVRQHSAAQYREARS